MMWLVFPTFRPKKNLFDLFSCPDEHKHVPLIKMSFICNFCSTILEEEKLQQEERLRMEMRRQITVSWDSGGSDEAPPKVRLSNCLIDSLLSVCLAWLMNRNKLLSFCL